MLFGATILSILIVLAWVIGGAALTGFFIYLIIKQVNDRNRENFEDRNN